MPAGGTSRDGLRVAAVAGLGYVVLAAVENLDFQSVPALGDSSAAVVDYYSRDLGAKVLTAVLGLVALGCYAVFALRLCATVTTGGRFGATPESLRSAAVVAAVLGPAAAAVGIGVRLWLAVTVDGASAASALAVHEFYLSLRVAGGTCAGVVLLVLGLAGLRDALPRPFRLAALVAGGWIVLSAVLLAVVALLPASAAATWAFWISFAGFVGDASWVGLAAGFLVLAPAVPEAWPPWPVTTAKVLFGLVALAAGVSGIALTALPNATGSYFSWPQKPAALAALIGGCYLAASVCYGLALVGGGPQRRWDEARRLLIAIMALSVPMAVTSVVHAEAFDFAFWPAWAWFALFFAFPVAALVTVYGGHRAGLADAGSSAPSVEPPPAGRRPAARPAGRLAGRPAATWVRVLLLAYCLAATAGAVALWTGHTRFLPVTVGSFGAQVFACWWAFAAVVAGWSAARPFGSPAAAPAVLVALPAVWMIESARTLPGWVGGVDGTRWFAGLALAVVSASGVWLSLGSDNMVQRAVNRTNATRRNFG